MPKALTIQPLIAFIDDDDGPMEFYEEALIDEGFRLERIRDCVEAIHYIQETTESPALWLIDLMMPVKDDSYKIPGERMALSKASNRGLGVGRFLYQQIRKRFPSTPIIMFTHLASAELLDTLEGEMDKNSSCEAKLDLDPTALVKLIQQRIKRTKRTK